MGKDTFDKGQNDLERMDIRLSSTEVIYIILSHKYKNKERQLLAVGAALRLSTRSNDVAILINVGTVLSDQACVSSFYRISDDCPRWFRDIKGVDFAL